MANALESLKRSTLSFAVNYSISVNRLFARCYRRLFPLLGLTLSGLQPDRVYDVKVDFVPVNQFRHRYVYHRSRWTVSGGSLDDVSQTPYCQHPSSLTRLRQTTVMFDKLKLTNNPANCNKHVRPSYHMQCAFCCCFLSVSVSVKNRN